MSRFKRGYDEKTWMCDVMSKQFEIATHGKIFFRKFGVLKNWTDAMSAQLKSKTWLDYEGCVLNLEQYIQFRDYFYKTYNIYHTKTPLYQIDRIFSSFMLGYGFRYDFDYKDLDKIPKYRWKQKN